MTASATGSSMVLKNFSQSEGTLQNGRACREASSHTSASMYSTSGAAERPASEATLAPEYTS
eukprot:15001374-Heterocapsa_arctica.AAC.1